MALIDPLDRNTYIYLSIHPSIYLDTSAIFIFGVFIALKDHMPFGIYLHPFQTF